MLKSIKKNMKENFKLIYVYDSKGTLVNGRPFIGFDSVFEFMNNEFEENVWIKYIACNKLVSQFRTNGDMIAGYYFRPCKTTVFKSKIKFNYLKLKR